MTIMSHHRWVQKIEAKYRKIISPDDVIKNNDKITVQVSSTLYLSPVAITRFLIATNFINRLHLAVITRHLVRI